MMTTKHIASTIIMTTTTRGDYGRNYGRNYERD